VFLKEKLKAKIKNANHHFNESWVRFLTKTVTYGVIILIMDSIVIYWFTGKTEIALGFMIASNIYTSVVYYVHERAWDRIKWGKMKNQK
jgi:uncharacterized membrane protein